MGNVSSIPIDHLPSGKNYQTSVMGYHELRQERVRALIRDRCKNKKSIFARDTGIDPTIVSRWFMKGAGRKNIGEELARLIEGTYELPKGSLVMPELTSPQSNVVSINQAWPFAPVTRKQYDDLPDLDKGEIIGLIKTKVREFEANLRKKKSRG